MDKKGVFYTLSLSLLMMLILALALLFLRHADSVESRLVELSFFQKMADLDTSVQSIFVEAFTSKSNLVFSSTASSIRIVETLPQNFTALDDLNARLKSDVESNFNLVNISLDSFSGTHDLLFMPTGIIYQHTTTEIIHVRPNLNITGYDIILVFTGNITSCTNNITVGGPITIDFLGQAPGPDCTVTQSNANQGGVIDLVVNGSAVSLTLGKNGSITMESNVSVQSDITIIFQNPDQDGYFQIPILIELFDTAFGFYKQSYPRFPLLP